MRLTIAAFAIAAIASGQSFELASIKPHPIAVDAPFVKQPGANPIRISGNRVDLRMVTVKDLVVAAYGVKEFQVTKGPERTSGIDSLYDISAQTGAVTPPTQAQVRPMLQLLLSDRFKLKLRRESKELRVHNLVVGKGGPKIKQVADDTPLSAGMRRGSMEQIAALLSLFLDRPVIDKTGLAGGIYEYSVRLAELDTDAPDEAEVVARTLTAIQDQLGLRAEANKATIDMLVIESAEKPSGN